ncbi:MAG: prepilin-type N-terminal cleavage/methylation domain-containing protein [Proteobacteria bacterium]|nr:prepilin-type N-terminal cleavage/methylation domain-containing protein [Pseudomonadota bacterium]
MILQNSTLKQRSGFTLLEVIIALFIFTLGILGIAAMQLRAIQGNSSGARLTEATAEAQMMIERIMEEPYANFIPPLGPALPSSTPSVEGLYNVTLDIQEMPAVGNNLPEAEAIWVTITVAWTEAAGPGRSVVVSFIKSLNIETSYEPI